MCSFNYELKYFIYCKFGGGGRNGFGIPLACFVVLLKLSVGSFLFRVVQSYLLYFLSSEPWECSCFMRCSLRWSEGLPADRRVSTFAQTVTSLSCHGRLRVTLLDRLSSDVRAMQSAHVHLFCAILSSPVLVLSSSSILP